MMKKIELLGMALSGRPKWSFFQICDFFDILQMV
jgi:hypothetical protein